jgi:hypothetical protein
MKKSMPLINGALSGFIIFIYFSLIYPISNPYPFSDDWAYVSVLGTGWRNIARWLFMEHGDHRLPFMEAVQYAMLRMSGFDFRWECPARC